MFNQNLISHWPLPGDNPDISVFLYLTETNNEILLSSFLFSQSGGRLVINPVLVGVYIPSQKTTTMSTFTWVFFGFKNRNRAIQPGREKHMD